MNIAFPAIIAFLFIIPGLIFLVFTVRLQNSASQPPRPPEPLSRESVLVVISAAVLHLMWVGLVLLALRLGSAIVEVRFQSVIELLSGRGGATGDREYEAAIRSVTAYPFHVAAYFLGLYFFSYLVSLNCGPRIEPRLIGHGFLIDRNARMGEWNGFFKTDGGFITIISTVVELGGVAYLFVGKLSDVFFDPATLELDRFVLEDVWRRRLDNDHPPPVALPTIETEGSQPLQPQTPEEIISDQWYSVEGDRFLIHYSETRTINIRYWGDPSQKPL